MKYNFDEVIDRSNNRSSKYDERLKKFGTEDVIPLWVADMDFKTAQPIIDACKKKAEEGIWGYTSRPASYSLLGLISYLTAGPIESKAWTITRGTKAPQAAGKIHSDFERGFIKADVISYEDLIANGSMTAARDKGLVRSEGKEYVMQDGDVVLFKFNV